MVNKKEKQKYILTGRKICITSSTDKYCKECPQLINNKTICSAFDILLNSYKREVIRCNECSDSEVFYE